MPEYKIVLVADDDDMSRDLARRVLTMNGYEVVTAINGSEAFESLNRYKQKLHGVVLDNTMPGMYGIEIMEYMREQAAEGDEDFERMRAVLCTTDTDDLKERVETMGYVFIAKPYKLNELVEAIKGPDSTSSSSTPQHSL